MSTNPIEHAVDDNEIAQNMVEGAMLDTIGATNRVHGEIICPCKCTMSERETNDYLKFIFTLVFH